jgi:hypothetical protein
MTKFCVTQYRSLTMNRYINSVGDSRPLLSADPQNTSHLPVDDDAWDSGVG